MSISSVFGHMLQCFLNEPSNPGNEQVYEDSRRFRRGLALWKSKTNIVLPPQLILFIESILFISVAIDAVSRPNLDWVNKIAEFCFVTNTLIFYFIPYFLGDDIDRLSKSVDFWWTHNLLEQEREYLKKRSVDWIETFHNYFFWLLASTCIGYSVIPLIKFFINDHHSYSELYIFRLWAPFLQERLWTFTLLYFFQMACIFFQFFGYGILTAYMMSIAVACRYQTQLVEISCLTIQQRVTTIVRKVQGVSERKSIFCTIFLEEIAESARHYQHVYRNWKEMCRLLSRMADIVFYSGMCIVIMFGVRVAAWQENKFILMTSFLFIVVVICNQYLFTIINGTFTNQIMVSCVPTISTFMGVEASREFFGKTINATYCYMSALVSMNRKYLLQ